MESMRQVNRVMEREIAKGSSPLRLDHIAYGDYSYQEVSNEETLLEILTYLLRIKNYKEYENSGIRNNVYMDIQKRMPAFRRTANSMERYRIENTIKKYIKRFPISYDGDIYVETIRCYMSIPDDYQDQCHFVYDGKDTYAFILSDRYISGLYAQCLLARKEAAIELEKSTKKETMNREERIFTLGEVANVLFQCILLDNVQTDDDGMYTELVSIYRLE